jgi:hypothetical protein
VPDPSFPIGDGLGGAGGKASGGIGAQLAFDGWDLPAELEELQAHVAGVEDERAIEVGELS